MKASFSWVFMVFIYWLTISLLDIWWLYSMMITKSHHLTLFSVVRSPNTFLLSNIAIENPLWMEGFMGKITLINGGFPWLCQITRSLCHDMEEIISYGMLWTNSKLRNIIVAWCLWKFQPALALWKKNIESISQMIHVWNIWLHLPHKWPKCR